MLKVPKTFQSELVKLDVKFSKELEKLAKSGANPQVQRSMALSGAIRIIREMNMLRSAEALVAISALPKGVA